MTQVVIPRLECWLAEDVSHTLLGMLVLQGEWIDQLYVRPDVTNAGIGSKLLDAGIGAEPAEARIGRLRF